MADKCCPSHVNSESQDSFFGIMMGFIWGLMSGEINQSTNIEVIMIIPGILLKEKENPKILLWPMQVCYS